MRFIEGIGYIDEQYSTVNTQKNINSTSDVSFDNYLTVETEKLNETSYNLDDIFKEASEKYNVSYDLLKAIAYNESGFKADATSQAGAMGIMQLMPSTAKAMGVTDAYDPYQNIMGGAKLLSTLSDMYDGNQTLMIAAYNAGSGNVAKYGGIPPFKETQNYVSKVLATLQSGVSTKDIQVASHTQSVNTTNYSGNITTTASSATKDTVSSSSSLSNQEYQLLMEYFETMMKIISDMGDNSDEMYSNQLSDSNDSLSDLFKLGSQISYNNSTINLY